MNSLKKYKSIEAENKAYKHYSRNVRKLRRELEEMGEVSYRAKEEMSLYWLISGLWDYWGKGYSIPLVLYRIDIEKINNYYLVSFI